MSVASSLAGTMKYARVPDVEALAGIVHVRFSRLQLGRPRYLGVRSPQSGHEEQGMVIKVAGAQQVSRIEPERNGSQAAERIVLPPGDLFVPVIR